LGEENEQLALVVAGNRPHHLVGVAVRQLDAGEIPILKQGAMGFVEGDLTSDRLLLLAFELGDIKLITQYPEGSHVEAGFQVGSSQRLVVWRCTDMAAHR